MNLTLPTIQTAVTRYFLSRWCGENSALVALFDFYWCLQKGNNPSFGAQVISLDLSLCDLWSKESHGKSVREMIKTRFFQVIN